MRTPCAVALAVMLCMTAVAEPEPPREPVEDVQGWLRDWADERELSLGPEVNEPQWDGSRPDYALAVDCLLDP